MSRATHFVGTAGLPQQADPAGPAVRTSGSGQFRTFHATSWFGGWARHGCVPVALEFNFPDALKKVARRRRSSDAGRRELDLKLW